MPHSHSHSHKHTFGPRHNKHYDKKAMQRTTLLAMFLVFVFTIIEFVGGYLSSSLALMADALHMLTDFVSLTFVYIGLHISQKSNNKEKTYGYSRFEIILSLLNSIFLIIVCVYIVYEAVLRFLHPTPVNPKLMLPVAVAGLLINLLVMYIFRRTESKNQKKQEKLEKPNSKNLLMESNILHFLSDALGSVFVIIAGITIYYTGWYIVDPLLSLLMVFLISNNAFKIIFSSINILMESAPKDIHSGEIETYLEKNVEGVLDIHHIHLWMLNEEENIITLHAVISKNSSYHDVIENIKNALRSKFHIEHSTIQVEEINKSCLDKHLA
ncbi:MAG: cation diffusion facilitator family transporter [Alphaproteobacteria bacterium]|jgi:cobalt-zinc-cadmium efflux system protein|nr:cation diffusion facilitator family transporter [Alphaproteobacteria bacterium]